MKSLYYELVDHYFQSLLFVLTSFGVDIQDASKEKTDGSLKTKDPEASAVQSVDLDDQPLSTWIEGVHSPVPFNGPGKARLTKL